MGFDGKTPKPEGPRNQPGAHRHKYWDYNLNKYIDGRCNCATGKYHVTKKDINRK